MGEVINFPLPKDLKARGKKLMKLAKQAKEDPKRQISLFKKATELFEMYDKITKGVQ